MIGPQPPTRMLAVMPPPIRATLWPPLPEGFRTLARIAGVDEVGRGPLAGPVVAAAVILPAGFEASAAEFARLADSKTVPARHREALAEALFKVADIGIASVPAPEIDRLNIRQASLLAMRRAIEALPAPPEGALVDGRDLPPGLAMPAKAIIKGDALVAAIAAASIIAKVARDAMMARANDFFPRFGFESNAGYPTVAHRQAIGMIGLSPLHRRSFGPCRGQAFENDTG